MYTIQHGRSSKQIEIFISIIITCLNPVAMLKTLSGLVCYKLTRGQAAQHTSVLQIAWLAATVIVHKCSENSFCLVSKCKERFMRCTSESHRAGPWDRAENSQRARSQAETPLFPPEAEMIQHKCEIRIEMGTAKLEPETYYIHAGVSGRVQ